MCVIVYLPKNIVVEESVLRSCHKQNPHSVGYMFANHGTLVMRKFLNLEEFIKTFHVDRAENEGVDFAIHFRIATSGKIDLDNCHPFTVTEEIGLMHNGILTCTPGDVDQSDTNKFRHHLAPLLKLRASWDNEFFWFMVKETIGSFNKLVFMRKDGSSKIVNDSKGTWEGGIWFSNMTWKPYTFNNHVNHTEHERWWGRNSAPASDAAVAIRCYACKTKYTYTEDGLCYSCRDTPKAIVYPGTVIEDLIQRHGCRYMVYVAPSDMAYLKHAKGMTVVNKSVGVLEVGGLKYLLFKDSKSPLIGNIHVYLSFMSALVKRRLEFKPITATKA